MHPSALNVLPSQDEIDGTSSRVREFSAVVMAVSSGSQLHPLTDATPKCMLPICNRPAISFPLELLEKSDFEDIIIVTTLQFEHDVKEYVENGYRTVCGGKARIRIVTTEETGSASALRDVRSKLNITNDFFLLSADVVTDIPLAYLAGVHRFRNATATALLQAPPPKPALEEEGKAPKPVNPSDPSVGVVAIDDKTGRLIYARAIADIDESLQLPKRALRDYPNVVVTAMFANAHVFVFKPSIFALLEEQKDFVSLIGEAFPYMVAAQFNTNAHRWATASCDASSSTSTSTSTSTPSSSVGGAVGVTTATGPIQSPTTGVASSTSSAAASSSSSGASAQTGSSSSSSSSSASCCSVFDDEAFPRPSVTQDAAGPVRVYAYVAPYTSFLTRCTTRNAYMALNRQVLSMPASAVEMWTPVNGQSEEKALKEAQPRAALIGSLFDKNVKLDKCTVVNSVVGSDCALSEGCAIKNSVLMARVSVEGGAQVIDSVVGHGAVIQAKAVLKNCTVRADSVVEEGKYENEHDL